MYLGLAISVLLHAALLGWALISFQRTPELRAPDTPAIEATIITPSELTRLKQGDPDSKELEAKAKDEPKPDVSKKEAPKPKPVPEPPPPPPPQAEAKVEPPPPPPEPAKPELPKPDPIAEKIAAAPPTPPEPEPPPTPGPTPDEQKALEQKLEQERQAEEARKAEEKRKLEEQKKAEQKKKEEERKKKLAEQKRLADLKKQQEAKKQFDPDRIAALIDKTPEKRGAPASAPTPPSKPTDYTGKTAGEREGKDTVLSAREQDLLKGMLKSQIAPCWRLPGGGGGTETPIVTLRWRLKRDGSLDGEPQVAQAAAGPLAQIANEAAMRAVKGCQPFRLPPDSYAGWQEIEWTFDPRNML